MYPDLPKQPAQIQTHQDASHETKVSQIGISTRKQNITQLAAYALELREQKLPGSALWARLTQKAVEAYADLPLETAARADAIVQDLAIVILGPFAPKYIAWFEKITPDLVEDPLVKQFYRDLCLLSLTSGPAFYELIQAEKINPPEGVEFPNQAGEDYPESMVQWLQDNAGTSVLPAGLEASIWRPAGYVGKLNDETDPGLDRHFGEDLRPQINDQTDNQIFHCFFYQIMAYISQAAWTIRAASVYHELFDKGGSTHDHTAALIAIETGLKWRELRDSQEPDFASWSQLITAAYAKEPPAEASSLAQKFRTQINELLNKPNPLDGLIRGAEYGLIRLIKGK